MRKKIFPLQKDQKGFTLLLTFILIITLLGLVFTLLAIAMHQSRHSGAHLDDKKAFYAAQAALRKAVWRLLYKDPPEDWTLDDGKWPKEEKGILDTGDGIDAAYAIRAEAKIAGDQGTVIIEGIGEVHGIARSVLREYQADLKEETLTPIRDSWREI